MPIFKSVNKDFFKTWSPEMAYVLGFFAADGSMVRNGRGAHFIEFKITDQELLESIRLALGSHHTIAHLKRGGENWKTQFRLQIGNKTMFEDLASLGMTQNKSLTLRMPNVPSEHLSHFVRGYFDGDGNVYANEYARKGRKTLSTTLLTGFTSGSKDFLEGLHRILSEHSIVAGGSLFARESYFRLHYSVQDSCGLYRFMYNTESSLFLSRKKTVFENYFNKAGIEINRITLGA